MRHAPRLPRPPSSGMGVVGLTGRRDVIEEGPMSDHRDAERLCLAIEEATGRLPIAVGVRYPPCDKLMFSERMRKRISLADLLNQDPNKPVPLSKDVVVHVFCAVLHGHRNSRNHPAFYVDDCGDAFSCGRYDGVEVVEVPAYVLRNARLADEFKQRRRKQITAERVQKYIDEFGWAPP